MFLARDEGNMGLKALRLALIVWARYGGVCSVHKCVLFEVDRSRRESVLGQKLDSEQWIAVFESTVHSRQDRRKHCLYILMEFQ
jgi:hypothetical protein